MKKRFILLSVLLLLLSLPALWLNLQQGIFWGDHFLQRTGDGYGPITMTRAEDHTEFSGILGGFSWLGEVIWENSTARVTFPDGISISGQWDGLHLCDLSGFPYAYTSDMITISVNNEPVPPSHTAQADLMCRMDREFTEARGSVFLVLLGAAAYMTGVLCVLFPDKMYFLGRRWRYDYAELSDTGRFMQKIGGWVCIGTSLFIMYLPLFYFLMD